jgi:hypothetical protein
MTEQARRGNVDGSRTSRSACTRSTKFAELLNDRLIPTIANQFPDPRTSVIELEDAVHGRDEHRTVPCVGQRLR